LNDDGKVLRGWVLFGLDICDLSYWLA